MASPELNGAQPAISRSWVPRFGRTERFAHWWTVVLTVTALLTGFGLDDPASLGGGRQGDQRPLAAGCSAIAKHPQIAMIGRSTTKRLRSA